MSNLEFESEIEYKGRHFTVRFQQSFKEWTCLCNDNSTPFFVSQPVREDAIKQVDRFFHLFDEAELEMQRNKARKNRIELDLTIGKAIALHNLLESLMVLNSDDLPEQARREMIASFAKDEKLKQVATTLSMELDSIRQIQEMLAGYPSAGKTTIRNGGENELQD